MEIGKICKKCLLAELDDKKLLADIEKAKSLLDEVDRASDVEYNKRLEICRECDYLNEGTCGACGCFVELRAASKTGRCPYKKW